MSGPPRPALVAVLGMPASGKTTLAAALAGALGWPHLSSDEIRKELAGLRPAERGDEATRATLYGAAMTRRTYTTLRRRAGRLLRQGRSVVVDATFGAPAQRALLTRLARRCDARLVALYCQAGERATLARLAARERAPDTVSDARLEQWPALRDAFREPVEWPDALVIDTTRPLAEAVMLARRAVEMASLEGGLPNYQRTGAGGSSRYTGEIRSEG